jgi:hypothetical protein
MDNLEVSNALAVIINILWLVCYVPYFPILIPHYPILTFNTDRPTNHYKTPYRGMKILGASGRLLFVLGVSGERDWKDVQVDMGREGARTVVGMKLF